MKELDYSKVIGKQKKKLKKNCRCLEEKTEAKSSSPHFTPAFSPLFASFPCCQTYTCFFYFLFSTSSAPPSILLPLIADHLEKGLQQPVVSVPVRLGPVEAVSVVAVHIVLGTPVLVEHVQSLEQRLGGQPRRGTTEVGLLTPPGGGRPDGGRLLRGGALPVEGRLEEAQQGHGGGGGGFWARLGVFLRLGLFGLCLWRWRGLLSRGGGVSHTSNFVF